MNANPTTRQPETILTTPIAWFMALAAAMGTASIYPLQPAVGPVSDALHASSAQIGLALACGPVGYLLGLATLVPLVDRFPPRRVVAVQFGVLALTLVLNAAVVAVWMLAVLVAVVGAGSSVGAQLSSVAGRFADPRRRATVLGIVTAGISAGIVAGRIVGGYLTDQLGWRGMLLVFAAACAVIACAAAFVLPGAAASVTTSFVATLRGLPGLYRDHPVLRVAAVRGALWFAAFCAVWSGQAVTLAQPPYSLSPERIGLYALAGLLGIVATRIAGYWTDRVGPKTVILIGLALAATAAMALAPLLSCMPAALVCLALFDAGLFAAQVANQATVLAIDPAAPARFNGAYMIVYFVGGSLGTAFGAAAAGALGWPATAFITAGAIGVAAAITATVRVTV